MPTETSALEKTLRLLAILGLDGKTQKEQVRLLDKAQFGQSEIASLLGTSPKAISVRLAEVRKIAKAKKQR